jgi:hypothetical protein
MPLLCAYLSIGLLVGLGANALLGWRWADPLAAFVIAGGTPGAPPNANAWAAPRLVLVRPDHLSGGGRRDRTPRLPGDAQDDERDRKADDRVSDLSTQ